MSWFWIAIASVLSGTLGAMGLGGGGILLLVLVWAGWPQMTAQGINLLGCWAFTSTVKTV